MIKIQCTHISKSYPKFWHVPELSRSVHQGTNPPQKHSPPYFLPSPLQIFQAPLFRQFPIYIVALWPLSPKKWWTPIILTFFIFNPSYLLIVTKFLVKICQFKFWFVLFFCRLKFHTFVYFLCNNCDTSLALSNHEYQIMKYFSATLCHNAVPQNKME